MAELTDLLRHLVDNGGSDLHVKPGSSPFIRINGRLRSTELSAVSAADTQRLAMEVMPPERAEEFQTMGETDFAMGISGLGRFRVSVLRQRGSAGLVLRRVLATPPSFDMLGLPPQVRQLAERRNGLVLITGPADSGKSTTVAAMLNDINENAARSIMTVEDPIEILHSDKQGFITQREVGTDTESHLTGLRRALRHDADVIYVDRIPDGDVMAMAIAAARGRLVITHLPSLNTEETVRRVIDFFPPHHARQTRHELASVLQGVICQRLMDRQNGKGRIAVFELMVATPRIHDALVEAPGSLELESLIAAGEYHGMQTMDQHLLRLCRSGLVNVREALSLAIHPQELRVQLE